MGYPTSLKNGSVIDSQRIKTLYDSWLKPLYNMDPNLAAMLFFRALDDNYEIPKERKKWFIRLSFLLEDGTLDPDFRNVIVSAISVDREESTLTIQRPEADQPGADLSPPSAELEGVNPPTEAGA